MQKQKELRIMLALKILKFSPDLLLKDSSILFPFKLYIKININIYGARWCLVIQAKRENGCLPPWAQRQEKVSSTTEGADQTHLPRPTNHRI